MTAREVLYDSETVLRLVDSEIEELRRDTPDALQDTPQDTPQDAMTPDDPSGCGAADVTRHLRLCR